MSKMAELDWQIEYMACEDGMSAVDIAEQLGCPIDIVNAWFKNCWHLGRRATQPLQHQQQLML
jgi:uncharacterized protein YjcR